MTLIAIITGYGMVVDSESTTVDGAVGIISSDKRHISPDNSFAIAYVGIMCRSANSGQKLMIPTIKQWLDRYYAKDRISSDISLVDDAPSDIAEIINHHLEDVSLVVVSANDALLIKLTEEGVPSVVPLPMSDDPVSCHAFGDIGPFFIAAFYHDSIMNLDLSDRINAAWEMTKTLKPHVANNPLIHFPHSSFKNVWENQSGDEK